ncbi:hypothetical protein KCU95_g953, partial [Aureobasidium melanogenum]
MLILSNHTDLSIGLVKKMSEDLERTVAGTHNIAIDSDALTLKQEMHLAVQSYNQKSKESNLRLLRDCVNAISTLNLTEQEKLNRIAQILFRSEDWGQNEDFSNQPESSPKQVGDYGWPPEWLEQVLGLPQLQRNCYRPPYSEQFSTMLVEEMIKVVFKGREEHKVVVPQELIAFFGCTQDDKDEAQWAWRVVIHLESDFDDGIVNPTRIFDSIFEFLNWYGDWYNRLDLEDFLEKLVEDYEFGG